MEKITGSELVKRVLKDPHGSIEKLIELSGRTETDWLEVKAAILPEYVVENGKRRYIPEKDRNDTDYAWNVAKAVVAIANTHGGAVILGINDEFNAVGLEASDKKGDLAKGEDNFARRVLDNSLRPETRCWKCGKETYELTVTTYYELLEYQFADFHGERVAVIIVNPIAKDAPLVLVEEKQRFRETLLVRAVGEEGRVRKLFRSRDIQTYSLHRDPRQENYALLYEQFLPSVPKPEPFESSIAPIERVRERLLHTEALLDESQGKAMSEICSCNEILVRGVIRQCYNSLANSNNVKIISSVQRKLSGDERTYEDFALSELFRLWKEAQIPKMWSELYGFTPAIFTSIRFDEIAQITNRSAHHKDNPSSHTVKRLFYSTLEFAEELFRVFDKTTKANISNDSAQRSNHNLPRIDYDFIGREDELNRILTWLEPTARPWLVSITGIGGVGKSALAIEAAMRCISISNIEGGKAGITGWYDFVVWTSAKQKALKTDGIGDVVSAKSNLSDIVTEIIKVVAPDHYKNLPEEKRQLEIAKELLETNPVLLVVDNMETIEDELVHSFLEQLPRPSKAIITDRRSVQASNPIRLTELSEEESFQLVEKQCFERNLSLVPEVMKKLAERTGGIPLAIVWAVGQMSAKNLDPNTLFDRLSDTGKTPVLEFLFAESFGRISKNAKSMLTALSLPDTPVTGAMLADWIGLDESAAQEALAELTEYAMVSLQRESSQEKGNEALPLSLMRSYKILPLTRHFIQNRRTGDINSLRELIALKLFKFIANLEEKPDWPSLETMNVVEKYKSLFAWAMEDAFDREDFNLVTSLMRWIGYSLGLRGFHDLRLRLGNIALEAATKTDQKVEAARNLITNIAWVHFIWYQFGECQEAATKGLKLARDAKHLDLEAIAIRTIGLVYKERGDLVEAERHLKRAEESFVQTGNTHFLAITYGSLGSLYRDLEKYDEAQRNLEMALEISKKALNTWEIQTVFLQKLARLMVCVNRLEEAEAYNLEALSILSKLNRPLGEAHCKYNQALIAEKMGDLAKSLAYIEEAARLFLVFGSKEDITDALERIRSRVAQ